MKLHVALFALALSLSHAVAARGQLAGLADDIILMSKGASDRQTARRTSVLGQAPGSNGLPFRYDPGGRGNPLDEANQPARRHARVGGGNPSVLSAAALSAARARNSRDATRSRLATRQAGPNQHRVPPLYGLLELPSGELEGPPRGMTLDQAIELLISSSPDLRSKRYEIPQARADVLTASLRANPLYFLSASNVPYQRYSPSRYGAVDYTPTLVQPFDINDKRGARMEAASHALYVLEAQYQNAVRLAVHELYLAYTDVIVARETLRYAEVSLIGAKALFEASRRQAPGEDVSESDRLNLAVQYETARLDVDQARSELLRTKHRLAAMLAIPREQAARLEVRGRIRPPETPLPGPDELVRMALGGRPDVRAFRLGINRARADMHIAKKERFDDVFVVYSPFQFQNNQPIGKLNATSFSLGLMGSIPLFDRNQGEIRRAETNVVQTRAALDAIERDAAAEVESALVDYQASREAVARIENAILPASERARTLAYQKHLAGRIGTAEYLFALRDRNEVVRHYRDALIRRRRSMLQLNTAVGRRLLP
ncbi:MAG TPA: TolC family protein [Pirellulales bacterium]|nr:TolC family protein [Pirellulales bacterium]